MPGFYPNLEMLERRLSRVTIINDFHRYQLDLAQTALVELRYLAAMSSLSFDEVDLTEDHFSAFNSAMKFLEG